MNPEQRKEEQRKELIDLIAKCDYEGLEKALKVLKGETVVLSTFLDWLMYSSAWKDKNDTREVIVTGDLKQIFEKLENERNGTEPQTSNNSNIG